MNNSTSGSFISKIKGELKKSKDSKYYEKFVFIVNKHKDRLRGSQPHQKCHFMYNWDQNDSHKEILEDSECSKDDSGISYDDIVVPPRPFITTAIIEPSPHDSQKSYSVPSNTLFVAPITVPQKDYDNTEEILKINRINDKLTNESKSNFEDKSLFDNLKTLTSNKSVNVENKPPNALCSTFKNEYIEDLIKFENSDALETISNTGYLKFKQPLPNEITVRHGEVANDPDDKFIVNIFESRQSKRWKRQSLPKSYKTHKIIILNNQSEDMIQKNTAVNLNEKFRDEIYFKMKKMRDIECIKMKEASKALRIIKSSDNKTWSEELLAEKILLETDLRFKLIVNKIRETKDDKHEFVKSDVSGAISLSNFQFEVIPEETKKNDDFLTFYLLTVSYDTTVYTTQPIQSSNDDKLIFNDTFFLKELNEDFHIKVEVYSLTLNTAKIGFVEKMLKKNSKCWPLKKIYFENLNTNEMEESSVLKPSFTLCGGLTITKDDIGNSFFIMQNHQAEKLKETVTATLNVDYMNLNTKYSGFLTLGKTDDCQNIINWERKWCSLINNTFSIYNYPQEEELDKSPVAFLNLEYCLIPLTKNPSNCPRKRTFVLKAGRPSFSNDQHYKHLQKKTNFILNKYYLSADNNDEFAKWTTQLESALEKLNAWQRLILKDDYYL